MADTYTGPVAFVQGVHYPVGGDGHADLSRPLRWVEGSTYRDAESGEQPHNELNHGRDLDLWPGEDD